MESEAPPVEDEVTVEDNVDGGFFEETEAEFGNPEPSVETVNPESIVVTINETAEELNPSVVS